MEEKTINDKTYRLVTLRNRTKWVSKDGDLINPYRNQKVGLHYNSDLYPCTGGVPVHLYVAHAWVDGYFDGAEVNHIDFDRNNYNADNLEWVTHEENIKHSVENNSEVWNSGKQGIHNGRAKFSEEDVINIRKLYNSGMSVMDILKQLYPDNKSLYTSISNICKRRTWNCI